MAYCDNIIGRKHEQDILASCGIKQNMYSSSIQGKLSLEDLMI